MVRAGSRLSVMVFACVVGGVGFVASSALARESGIQGTPDGKRVLVNKDVGSERYAIAQDRADQAATGNVFFTDERPPAFLHCAALGGTSFACSVADPCPSNGRQSGIQRRPDGKGILVSKDVGGDRYAITANLDDGSLTGNVFFTDGRPPVFLHCQTLGGATYSCSGTDRCRDTACAPYAFLSNVTLPADFFTVPDGCPAFQSVGNVTLPADFFAAPSETRGPLAVGTRQLVGNNPFGGLTKNPTAASAGMRTGVRPASTFLDETLECPAGGSRRVQCEVGSDSEGPITFASFDGFQCAFPGNDGSVTVEDGIVFFTVPNFADCDPVPFKTGREILEERDPLVFEFFDPQGSLFERQIDATARLVTYGAPCTNRAGIELTSEQARGITGDLEAQYFFSDGAAQVLNVYDDVAQTIEYSNEPECVSTYTRSAGSVTTFDDFTGDVFTTVYGGAGLEYTLEDSQLLIEGGLTSQCTGSQSSFTYRTVQAPLFDPADPEGCPRDGRVEISSNGVVIGHAVFTVTGGIQLIEVDGRTADFPTCNDSGLSLRCQ